MSSAFFYQSNKLKAPVIGVLIAHQVLRKLRNRDYSFKSYPRVLEMARCANEADSTLYYFSPRQVSFSSKTIKGIYLERRKEKWIEKEFPFPDVLYDRLASKPSHTLAQKVRRVLDEEQVKKINSISYFNKWEVYEKLSKHPRVSKYLPLTVKLSNKQDLTAFLDQHEKVYLKAVRSGRGKRVMRVQKLKSDTGFEYRYYREGLEIGTVSTIEELLNIMEPFFDGRDVIMQQAVDLIEIKDSAVDFRSEVQRNGKGELVITGVSARMGTPHSPITIHSSAYILEEYVKRFLKYSPEEWVKLKEKVEEFLLDIYRAIEEEYGAFGEIGIDFGLDKQGKIWFIEPNAKSAKVSLMKAYDKADYIQAFINPIEYAKYITYAKQ